MPTATALPATSPAQRPVEKLVEYRSAHRAARSEAAHYFTNTPAQVQFRFANPVICQQRSGIKQMRVGGSASFLFGPGDVLFVPPGMAIDVDLGAANPDEPIECDCLEVETAHVDAIVARINERLSDARGGARASVDWQAHALLGHKEARVLDLARLFALYSAPRDVFSELLIDNGIDEALLRLFQLRRAALLNVTMDPAGSPLWEAVRLIRERLDQHLSTDELARTACVSEATLRRQFRKHFGASPGQFANRLRIEEAKRRLHRSDEAMESLAFGLGFSDASHFSRMFRQSTGESPAEYRRQRQCGEWLAD